MTLSSAEKGWLAAVFDTLYPSGVDGGMPFGARDLPLDRFADELTTHAPARVITGMRAVLWFLQWLAPLVFLRRPRTFTGLEPTARLVLLETIRTKDVYLIREMPLLFKLLGGLALCGQPAVHRELGIAPTDDEPPDWMGDARLGGDTEHAERRRLPFRETTE